MSDERLYDRLTTYDFEKLKELALDEYEKFFKRNPHLKGAYYHSPKRSSNHAF
ncbi:MAG: hypothetical protein ACETWM_07590 [Candidatus Lokiarchaeia archaeon]